MARADLWLQGLGMIQQAGESWRGMEFAQQQQLQAQQAQQEQYQQYQEFQREMQEAEWDRQDALTKYEQGQDASAAEAMLPSKTIRPCAVANAGEINTSPAGKLLPSPGRLKSPSSAFALRPSRPMNSSVPFTPDPGLRISMPSAASRRGSSSPQRCRSSA